MIPLTFPNIIYDNSNNIICKQCSGPKKYKTELMFLEELQHLDTVVKLVDCCKKNNVLFLEYVPYRLDKAIESKILNLYQKLNIITQLCSFIIESHELGIVHNDLKSKNILLTKDFDIKVIDFDLSEWSSNPEKDIKHFKFIILQLIYDIDYITSYKYCDKYIEKLPEETQQIFKEKDIYKIQECIQYNGLHTFTH